MNGAGLWKNTGRALLKLQSLLHCGICNKSLEEPHWLRSCGHFFCRLCVEERQSQSCAVCGVPCIVKDFQPSRQLKEAVDLSVRLASVLEISFESDQSANADKSDLKMSMKMQHNEEDSLQADIFFSESVWDMSSTELEMPGIDASFESELAIVQKATEVRGSDVGSSEIDKRSRKLVTKISSAIRDVSKGTLSVVQLKMDNKNMNSVVSKADVATKTLVTEVCRSENQMNTESKPNENNSKLRSKRKLIQCETNTGIVKHSAKRLRSITNLSDHDNGNAERNNSNADSGTGHNDYDDNGNGNDYDPYDEYDNYLSSFHKDMAIKKYCAGRKRKLVFGNRSSDGRPNLSKNNAVENISNMSSSRPTVNRPTGDFLSSEIMHVENNSALTLVDNSRSAVSENSNSKIKSGHEIQFSLKQAKLDLSGNVVRQKSKRSFSVRTDVTKFAERVNSFNTSDTTTSTPKPMKRNAKGETPLHIAVIKGDRQRVELLLLDGVDPNVKDNANWTPLHEACNHGHTDIAELLLQHGALINTPGSDNATPLHDAVENYRLDCVKLLVSWGASKTMRDLQGRTVLNMQVTEDMKDALNVPVMSKSINERTENSSDQQIPVVLTTSLSHKERLEVAACAENLVWKFTTTFSPQVTHVVTMIHNDGSCPRTVKYLQAVLAGKWIVNLDWITTCADFTRRISEEDFEVSGSTLSPRSLGPCRGRKNASMQLPGLFSGCNFFFFGEFHSPAPPRDQLISLVRLASANILSREPKTETLDELEYTVPFHAEDDSALSSCGYYIVCDIVPGYQSGASASSGAKIEEIIMLNNRLCRVTSAWILASISEFRLRVPKLSYKSSKIN